MAADRKLRIPRLTWMMLVNEMRRRGKGRRESGAFLLGAVGSDSGRVTAVACYDDLDPDALKGGVVTFHARGYSTLWEVCKKRGLEVLADVHTHPSSDVRQSWIDQENPMLPVKGHIAMIMPSYGRTSRLSLAGVGIYVFRGGREWASVQGMDSGLSVALCAW